jgi:hypothetical protein
MAKQDTESSVYSVTEIIGTSPNSWEDASKNAVELRANSLRRHHQTAGPFVHGGPRDCPSTYSRSAVAACASVPPVRG